MRLVGVDIGGTFTDAVVYDSATGALARGKASSTPGDPARGVLAALDALGVELAGIERFVHGVTIGTNAILERKGAAVWLLVTAGFGDVLEIARTNRTRLYDIKTLKPAPLVPRERAIEIGGRLRADGGEHQPLALDDLRDAAARLGREPPGAIALCFLHSYRDPAHERAAAAMLRAALPGWFFSVSSEVLPEMREYERCATTALNAYIGPLTERYLGALAATLAGRGYRNRVFIMTSGGGVVTAERAMRFPVHTVLSGPAGGVAAAVHLGASLGLRDLITYDMGGTSTDVCLIQDLQVPVTGEQMIAEQPNRTPQIQINSVGAGGGSIAWIDAGPALQVGPRSAGADPGPACYGRGGVEPTVTDANLLLARLSPETTLAGGVALDRARAAAAVEAVARRLSGLDLTAAAEGIVQIAVARMVSAIKEISIARGHDPRDFTLVAYGGAGPMHAALIAQELEMPRLLVPPGPGNFSAFGALISDIRHDHVRTRLIELDRADLATIDAGFAAMEEEACAGLIAEGVPAARVAMRRALGMRYLGQSWDLIVNLPERVASTASIAELFHAAHLQRFGYRGETPIEIVAFRLAAIGAVDKPALAPWTLAGDLAAARRATRRVCFARRFLDTPVYDRDRLPAAACLAGPAIIEEMGAVTVLPPGWSAEVGRLGELMLERPATTGQT